MRKLFLPIFLLLVSLLLFVRSAQKPIISPLPETKRPSGGILGIFVRKKDPEQLEQKIKEAIGTTWSNYSILVKDLEGDFELAINEHEQFTAASVNKLPIFAAVYALANEGSLDMDRTITLQESDIQDYGTGSIRYDPPGTTYSVKTLVRLMMQKSDNTAAFLLGRHVIGLDRVQALVSGWGLAQTSMEENKTSNADMATLMEKIYNGEIANNAATKEMLGFLRDSDFENRLAGQLPNSAIVYHKIGSGDTGEIHDVGIVVEETLSYYIGILTTNTRSPEVSEKLEATISRIVYDFLN